MDPTFQESYSRYHRSHDLISVGAYVPGSDPELDLAIKIYPALESFLQQGIFEQENFTESLQKLSKLLTLR